MKPPTQGEFQTLSASFEMISSTVSNPRVTGLKVAWTQRTNCQKNLAAFHHRIDFSNLAQMTFSCDDNLLVLRLPVVSLNPDARQDIMARG
jgi:hypothetical protein